MFAFKRRKVRELECYAAIHTLVHLDHFDTFVVNAALFYTYVRFARFCIIHL